MGPVTNQSTPGQAKHVCTLLWHTLVGPVDITATLPYILTSFTTQLRWPRLSERQCSPWEFKPKSKALVRSRPFPVEGRNIWDLLQKGEAIPRTEVSSKAGYTAQPPLLLSFPTPSSALWCMCCLNQSRFCVTSPFSLQINGALLGIFKRAKIKHHGTTENLKNRPYPRSGANPRNDGACAGILRGEALSVSQPSAQAVQLPPSQPFLQLFPSGQAQPPHPHLHEPAQPSPRAQADPSLPLIARKLLKFTTQAARGACLASICYLRPGLSTRVSPKPLAHQYKKAASKAQHDNANKPALGHTRSTNSCPDRPPAHRQSQHQII